ncbi:MAG: type II toxin-antitoxin system VapC family toxin [Anaerolineales bacterium]|nr:type II toxin-antitoxin system VapC family toxin [Anaerolineales bacterium]
MSDYISDTHALIWYLSGSSRLGDGAREVFDSVMDGDARIFIPAIVVAELMMFSEKRKNIEVEKVLAKLRSISGFEFLALLPETAEKIRDLTVLPDIHDRLIVAEALLQKMPLLSIDESITKSKLVDVVW